ncbi:MAG: hypothetical protein JRN45_08955 [Nitrososphaerota archaeon]|nr:hypothetical protein [Nitrososphaerota archaeon]
MVGGNTGWSAASEYAVSWGDPTTVPWSSTSTAWGEVAASFGPAISSCSSSGGQGNGYYYTGGFTNQPDRDGSAGYINEKAWNYFSGSNGHLLEWTTLLFDDGTGPHWVQVGYGIGDVGGQVASTRLIYFEISDSTYSIIWITGHTIPDNDNGYAKAFAYQTNGDGTHTFELDMNSPSAGGWSTHPNVGTLLQGQPQAFTENEYISSGSCNTVSGDSLNSMVYSSTVSNNPTWFSWTGTCEPQVNSPYVVVSSSCPTNWSGYGA